MLNDLKLEYLHFKIISTELYILLICFLGWCLPFLFAYEQGIVTVKSVGQELQQCGTLNLLNFSSF
jgi:hypothetical protein